jgi:hypothetical protein
MILSLFLCVTSIPFSGISRDHDDTLVGRPTLVSAADTLRAAFIAEFQGGLTGTVKGKAMFDVHETGDLAVVKLILYRYKDNDDFEAINFLRMEQALLPAGTHVITEDGPIMVGYLLYRDGMMTIGSGDAGSLAIAHSDDEVMTGTFSFTGELTVTGSDEETMEFSVIGRFHAPRGDETALPTAFR